MLPHFYNCFWAICVSWFLQGGWADENDRFDLRCFSCLDAKDPMSCTAYEICGAGEECFTRKFTDHLGKPAFRLGCESKILCDLYKNALTIVGKRTIEDDSQRDCFDCCDADSCNSNMCGGNTTQGEITTLGPMGENVTTSEATSETTTETTSTPTTTETTVPPPMCPHTYLTGPGSCYLFVNSSHTWHEGDVLCKQLGAKLMSINNKTEDDFITNYLNTLSGSPQPDGYWVGGYYDKSTSEWRWQDGTRMTYVRWGPHQPVSYVNYNVNLFNPGVSAEYHNWKWSTNVEYASNRWLICERPFV
ncbi:uncharacterized protein [Haliotis asinina]|uniref:uncharacterized protein n=1 Tax=Haliotis asinina TaxID=109174 RepID=UPI00353256A7